MEAIEKIKQDICEVGRLLYHRGYVVSNDGNISVRTGENEIWITPSGVGKARMSPSILVKTDLEGNILEGTRYPSSEIKMHLMVYRSRPDVKAVVHAHPPVATSFAICRKPLSKHYLAEMVLGLGDIPVTEFAMLSTEEVPQSIEPYVHNKNAVLLANHGALAWGPNLWAAFDRMEVVEQTAKVHLYVEQIGGGVELTREQTETLRAKLGFYSELAGERK